LTAPFVFLFPYNAKRFCDFFFFAGMRRSFVSLASADGAALPEKT
jgi:hypothetical protein